MGIRRLEEGEGKWEPMPTRQAWTLWQHRGPPEAGDHRSASRPWGLHEKVDPRIIQLNRVAEWVCWKNEKVEDTVLARE